MDDDLLSYLDESAVDSNFYQALLRTPCLKPVSESDVLEVLSPTTNDESSCSTLSYASSASSRSAGSCEEVLVPLSDSNVNQQSLSWREVLDQDPLLRIFVKQVYARQTMFFKDPNRQHLIVAQNLSVVGDERRYYDVLNMLEGVGLLKRGPITMVEGARCRILTWFGSAFMKEDFQRILEHGERSGLVTAVRAVLNGDQPVCDRFTAAVTIDREEATTYTLETRRKARGKCPLKIGIQRLLVILLAAKGPLHIDQAMCLFQLPYPDVNLQRRYFYIREILIQFGLARALKQDDHKSSAFEYCGPVLEKPCEERKVVHAIPLYILKGERLTPLKLEATPEIEDACCAARPGIASAGSEIPVNEKGPAKESFDHPDIPASLFETTELSPSYVANSENVPPSPVAVSDCEDLLLRSSSNASSALHRTDTLLPWSSFN